MQAKNMSFSTPLTNLEKEAILIKLLDCDICRQWLAFCLMSSSWDDETVKREAYYQKYKDHIDKNKDHFDNNTH
jgi:hypothetical protein